MADTVIQAEHVGKKYIIGHLPEGHNKYLTLREVLVQGVRGLWHRTHDLVRGRPIIQGDTLEEVWALRDVSFEIRRGEIVGIIGRNGTGKSTLLKILSRITEPTAGRVTIRGRVASLLEVGTGFHQELSGRENIYLNGAVLGMARAEIRRKFDEIVAFAEAEKFLDTPVKRYSSGMYVRLAFAIAAHLEPEILLVDEVLAVGDASFQRKCLGKMGDVARAGRTVIFVSHNMAAVENLCGRALVLGSGRLVYQDTCTKAIEFYTKSMEPANDMPNAHKNPYGKPEIIHSVGLLGKDGKCTSNVAMGEDFVVEVVTTGLADKSMNIGVRIRNVDRVTVASINDTIVRPNIAGARTHREQVLFAFRGLNLAPGPWYIDVSVVDKKPQRIDYWERATAFQVASSDYYGTGAEYTRSHGYVFPEAEISIIGVGEDSNRKDV